MLSRYFEIKTKTEEFKNNLNMLFEELKNKKVLLYGAGQDFVALDKTYDFKNKLNIIGIADFKFKDNGKTLFKGYRKFPLEKLSDTDFDVILITSEQSKNAEIYLKTKLRFTCDIKSLFVDDIKDEQENLNYLFKHKFEKTLPKLIKDLKGKRVVIYGVGVLWELINRYFDLSELNVIAVSDKRFSNHKDGEMFSGKKVCSVEEIEGINPDCVIVATKLYTELIRTLKQDALKNVAVRPLIKKSFLSLLKEVWS